MQWRHQEIQQPNHHDEKKITDTSTAAADWSSGFVQANVNQRENQLFLGGCARGFPKVMDMFAVPAGRVSHPCGSGQQPPAFGTHKPAGAGVGMPTASEHPEQLVQHPHMVTWLL